MGSSGGNRNALVMMAILFSALFACLVLLAQCRPQLLNGAGRGARTYDSNSFANNSSSNATVAKVPSLDESKLTVIFCVIRPLLCMPPSACYFCIRTEKYYKTDDECKANCGPACNPHCPGHMSLNRSSSVDATVNATLN